ncbi:MAG TPA: hypothetical protein HPP77_02375 [Candidatus Hydrogenedentes bacterium]|nr:hypothetical protein [Candidatus Hydrogenedentota bacterium]HIJ74895.1 hypothetical protein [Candidatus Hydrogenedentota bacterium]
MSRRIRRNNRLAKLAKRGYRGHPIATVAYYGPDNRIATKVAVGIVTDESSEVSALKRWFSEAADIRQDAGIAAEIVTFIRQHGAKSVVVTDRIIGCPHEAGKDYPEGSTCPQCPFWANRDRFTHEIIE